MRHNSNNRRSRGKGRSSNNGGGKNSRMQVFDSNGPEVRIRGTAHQVAEKYEALAKDAKSAGDYTLAENYLQHAEHYQRIVNSFAEQQEQQAKKQQEKEEDLSLPASVIPPANTDGQEQVQEEKELESA